MQFQVPQFIDTEDKVVGPFSLRQFAYVGGGGIVCAIFYFMLQTWLFVIFSIIIMGLALAVSFVKIQGRPLFDVIVSAGRFYWRPQIYIWQTTRTPARRRSSEGSSAVENIASGMAKKASLQSILADSPLHKSWENLQTGSPLVAKNSDKQFLEKKMEERYQIYQKTGGDRDAARRVDYR